MVSVRVMSGSMPWLAPVWATVRDSDLFVCSCREDFDCRLPGWAYPDDPPDLLVTVGWRHMLRRPELGKPPLGVVGFHSALLPEYPGRAPVPWAILRGDEFTANTMLYLTDEPDAGDIIDRRTIPVTTAAEMNRRMGETAAEMLRQHLPALLTGTAPRTPQDRTRRGPLTTADGWQRLTEAQR
jgi:folate-dependent phosphoribosylglycinamide formyltransferase PurN